MKGCGTTARPRGPAGAAALALQGRRGLLVERVAGWLAAQREGPGLAAQQRCRICCLLPACACRYVWHNGNQYDGEWRSGKMHDQGTLKWITGKPGCSAVGCAVWEILAG